MSDIETKATEAQALLNSDEPETLEVPPVASAAAIEAPFDMEPEVVEVDAPASPPAKRKTARKKAPTTPRRPPSKLAKFLPDAERVKIWKRELGKRGYVRDYSLRDLAHAQDIESFIQTYVVPTYGEGDYDVEAIGTDGNVIRNLTMSVMDPRKTPIGVSPADTTLTPVVDRLLSRIDALEQASREPPKSMTDQIREVSQVQQMLGGNDDMSPLMLLMLSQQQQAQPQASLSAELAEVRAQLRAVQQQAAAPASASPVPLPPLLPAEPPVDIAAVIREATNASRPAFDFKELAAVMRPEQSPMTEMVGALGQLAPLIERMLGGRTTDLEALRNQQLDQLREQIRDLKTQPSRGIREVIEDMSAVSQFVGQARRGPAREESFWGFLSKLLGQFPTAMESVGGLVDRIREEQATGGSIPKTLPAKRPEQFPDDFGTYVQAINSATDDAQRIGATLTAFQRLGESPKWRLYLEKVMALAKSGKAGEALEFVTSFLEGLQEAKLVGAETVRACSEAFEKHSDKVLEALGGTSG